MECGNVEMSIRGACDRRIEVPIPDDLLQLVDERAKKSGLNAKTTNARFSLDRLLVHPPSVRSSLLFANR
jgi:hypothetical protein